MVSIKIDHKCCVIVRAIMWPIPRLPIIFRPIPQGRLMKCPDSVVARRCERQVETFAYRNGA